MRCAADSALSEQQRRQVSATAVRAEYQIVPQARRKSCNGLSHYGFWGDATAYAEVPVPEWAFTPAQVDGCFTTIEGVRAVPVRCYQHRFLSSGAEA
jgi:hypothetical protein